VRTEVANRVLDLLEGPYPYRDLLPIVRQARAAGFGVTIHVGEEGVAPPLLEHR
jgi:hypothetical protein